MKLSLPAITQPALDRWVLLRRAEADAAALTADRREAVVRLHEGAATRIDAALGEHGVPALILARAAIPLLLEAAATARGDVAPPGAPPAELWERYDALVAAGQALPVPSTLAPAREHALAGQSVDVEIQAHGDARVDEAIRLATFLSDGVELRTPRAIRVQRWLRAGALAVFGVATLVELFIHRPKANRALHANVVSSSRRPGSGPPQDLTNGAVESGIAFATKDEADAWITIDLGSPARVSEVTLLNGPDHQDDSLPFRLETSVDGAAWEAAGQVASHFTPAAPAVVAFTTRSARFVRIHAKPSGALYLNEVEVR